MKTSLELIFQAFQKRSALRTSELCQQLHISRQAVHRHLSTLLKQGKILKLGTGKKNTFYLLNTKEARAQLWKEKRAFRKRSSVEGLEEDQLLKEIGEQPDLLSPLSEDARKNFGYAFTEMVNNAIEHAETPAVTVDVVIEAGIIMFSVSDTGIGIFERLRQEKGLTDEMAALQELLKGKQTTLPERHSGEGIFFTSKIADRFTLESHQKKLTIDNTIPDIFLETIRFRKGTRVHFEQRIDSTKKLEALFRRYTNEAFRFQKSVVNVRLYEEQDAYVSRSQAKRLVHALESFEEIVLDFKDVQSIGQAFADEIFCVFHALHPEIRLIPLNCNEDVDFMIARAKERFQSERRPVR